MFVSVIGGSDPSEEETGLAEEVGRELARRGVTLICGGLEGVMEAACRGAASQGGTTVGILPGNDRHAANAYVKIPIVTGMGYARNAIVAKSAQAVIAIGGSYGTLSEIAYALQSDVPVIGLGNLVDIEGGRRGRVHNRCQQPRRGGGEGPGAGQALNFHSSYFGRD